MDTVEERQIRAVFDDKTIRVYQAYSHEIADSALKHGTFVSPPFSMNRMTWIKPSFLWMMYRSGWATKPGRERILAIDITHVGFEWALDHAILSTYNPELHKSENIWQAQLQSAPVRLQWDPDRDIHLRKMPRRAIQIGLAGDALRRYVNEWITKITDITPDVHVIREVVSNGHDYDIKNRLPVEEVYSINQCLRQPQIT